MKQIIPLVMASAITMTAWADTSSMPTLAIPAAQPKTKSTLPTLDSATQMEAVIAKDSDNVVNKRILKEESLEEKAFAIAFYQPTYIMPFYYTRSPDNGVYAGTTPDGESLKRDEIKYQLSFKVPLWRDILNYPSTLYLAYTQMSYWQAYNHTAFFRETDYQPEMFFANELDFHLYKDWRLNFFNVGAMHQSNGEGGSLERSWNRVYLKAIASTENFMLILQPWWVVNDSAYQRYNPHMASYLGYGEVVMAYKWNKQVISLQARNFVRYGGQRATATLSYSFPITAYINGYVQVFSGYGQSLLEYNHRTNSFGIGIALSNFV